MTPKTPFGWYADPEGKSQWRYWDGQQWRITKSVGPTPTLRRGSARNGSTEPSPVSDSNRRPLPYQYHGSSGGPPRATAGTKRLRRSVEHCPQQAHCRPLLPGSTTLRLRWTTRLSPGAWRPLKPLWIPARRAQDGPVATALQAKAGRSQPAPQAPPLRPRRASRDAQSRRLLPRARSRALGMSMPGVASDSSGSVTARAARVPSAATSG